ncbi:MAG: hypothetical protein ACI8QZ_003204 [Chlamydiales bacterium]|jgi:hypothetical protein
MRYCPADTPMNTRFKSWLLTPVLSAMLLGASRPTEPDLTPEGEFAVVVNAANDTHFSDEVAARRAVRRLFLRTSNDWGNHEEAKPFAPRDGDAAYAAYLTAVLDMSKAELARHWISMKNKRGVAPPKEIGSVKIMIRYVGRYDGGVGIIPVADTQGTDLKVLFTF